MKSSENNFCRAGRSGTDAASSQTCSSLRKSSSVKVVVEGRTCGFANARREMQANRVRTPIHIFISHSSEIRGFERNRAFCVLDTESRSHVPSGMLHSHIGVDRGYSRTKKARSWRSGHAMGEWQGKQLRTIRADTEGFPLETEPSVYRSACRCTEVGKCNQILQVVCEPVE